MRIENVMIDCGIPFNRMKEELYKCDTLLLTHIHSDHIKPQTLESIYSNFPRIKVYGNYEVAANYHVNNVLGSAPIELKNVTIYPYEGKHDVAVTYFSLHFKNGHDVLYATDTNKVENPNEFMYDYVFLESNYDEQKIDALRKDYSRKSYDPWIQAKRHLSKQECKVFYYTYRKDSDSPLIELHQSSRFY